MTSAATFLPLARALAAVCRAFRKSFGFTSALAPFGGTTSAVEDDHIPFIDAGIPAVDLIDFTYGPGPTPGPYWHTPQDTLDKVCPSSLGAVGRAALVAIPEIR